MKTNMKYYYWASGILIFLCLVLAILYPIFIGFSISDQSSEWANYGKYLGGVIGPLLGLLAFIGVLLSIANQNSENYKSETENRIIKHIEFHHNICNNVKIPYDIKETKFKEGRQAFEFLYEKYLKTYLKEVEQKNPHLDEEQRIDNAFSKLYKKEGNKFGFYFRNLYYLIKYIDDSKEIDKNHYSKLVRAQLSTSEIQLLMYNCLFKKGKGFKELVIKYGLLNGIDETEMIKPNHKQLFDDKAFE
ncbi:putative phage abortive infection protein [Tenacibaculum maritimum]|uniref:putative phage abortive infection protein n=1 Tax=Tenacibaculum maritimum TaxID=107401 RepID=UPI001E374592|nr:putative phage abortive infection protein [Tenacibaculum maritimum]MCD9563310.1 putative phage abortive infection protein [Tenacibaculum maritimum]MCD9565258.1 putative phage abortive infection protein [Tenacibaculum maritimum]MCD9578809.1 putative phage abortive infection protein [Tenacibaculum maritimum]MCD9597710.1 putative phage abortive infection protein [Tenacibaculum maritimum]MCD9613214.1 putative phage abortive infection protein [Tenacibaculum maritimum]